MTTRPAAGDGASGEALEAALGHAFRDRDLLRRALTHPSRAGENYQLLEFVGDRVLALVVADLLMERFPEADEGQLAKRHAHLVSEATLAAVGDALSLSRFIRTGDGAAAPRLPSVVADCCEAVIGALYRDGGLAAARAFVAQRWRERIDAGIPRVPTNDLQEWLQGRGRPLPEYRVVACAGAPHEPEFTVELAASGFAPVRARGPSKRIARTRAAEKMLEQIASGA